MRIKIKAKKLVEDVLHNDNDAGLCFEKSVKLSEFVAVIPICRTNSDLPKQIYISIFTIIIIEI